MSISRVHLPTLQQQWPSIVRQQSDPVWCTRDHDAYTYRSRIGVENMKHLPFIVEFQLHLILRQLDICNDTTQVCWQVDYKLT